MTAEPLAIEALVSRSSASFRRSPMVGVPFAAAMLALGAGAFAGMVALMLAQRRTDGDNGPLAVAIAAWVAFALVAGAVAWVATFALADAAWSGRARLRTAGVQLGGRSAGMILTLVALAVCGLLAVLLAIPTLFLSLPLYGVLTLYALPITALGGPSGFAALAASYRLARATFRRSALVWFVLAMLRLLMLVPVYGLLLAFEAALAVAVARHGAAPLAGTVVALVAAYALVLLLLCAAVSAAYAFWAIALTGWYRSLTAPAPDSSP